MWPVGVIIDEADAFLGDRNQQGDSGTSNRIFAELSTFMANTEYRGKIVWFLITSRPDLLPIDLKRQGRAEEHLALLDPETEAEHDALFRIMLKKGGLTTPVQSSGSDRRSLRTVWRRHRGHPGPAVLCLMPRPAISRLSAETGATPSPTSSRPPSARRELQISLRCRSAPPARCYPRLPQRRETVLAPITELRGCSILDTPALTRRYVSNPE